jgi:hypothetical protein
MTQSDWEGLGALVGLFILFLTIVWVLWWDDYFDGGW